MNYTIDRGVSVRRRKTSRELLERWRRAGYPKHYREDHGGKRIMDADALREALDARRSPALRALRGLRGLLEYRRALKRLDR